MRWKTEDILKSFEDDPTIIFANHVTTSSGGDWDTPGIILTPNNSSDSLHIRGFRYGDEPSLDDADDVDVSAIEVTDGRCSSGGLNTSCRECAVLYANVVSKLRQDGWLVVNTMDDYF